MPYDPEPIPDLPISDCGLQIADLPIADCGLRIADYRDIPVPMLDLQFSSLRFFRGRFCFVAQSLHNTKNKTPHPSLSPRRGNLFFPPLFHYIPPFLEYATTSGGAASLFPLSWGRGRAFPPPESGGAASLFPLSWGRGKGEGPLTLEKTLFATSHFQSAILNPQSPILNLQSPIPDHFHTPGIRVPHCGQRPSASRLFSVMLNPTRRISSFLSLGQYVFSPSLPQTLPM